MVSYSLMVIVALILLGLCFGSFVNALVWRLYQQSLPTKKQKLTSSELSITRGRSVCTHCGHKLTTKDLLPVISWVSLKGRCRYCKKAISWQYPTVELATASLFVVSYLFWPYSLVGWGIISFGLWLVCLTGLLALLVYDLRWMLLPNKIVFPLYGLAAIFVGALALEDGSLDPIGGALMGVLVGGGVFYILFQASSGRWIGGGDVKLGFLLGALVASPLKAGMAIFIASLLGSIIAALLMITGRAKRTTRIPFGPFLIVGTIIVLLFGSELKEWYISKFIGV